MSKSFSNPGAKTTTARELSQALETHALSLRKASERLAEEMDGILKSRAAIREEHIHHLRSFVETTLQDLSGTDFDDLANLALNTPELPDSGLVYFRDKLVRDRDSALAHVSNDILHKQISVEDFRQELDAALQKTDAVSTTLSDAQSKLNQANGELKGWQKDGGYGLVKLNSEIRAKGAPAIGNENRKYYDDPQGIFPIPVIVAAARYLTRGSAFRAVRDEMEKLGHGVDGKDVLAELDSYASQQKSFEEQVEQARQSKDKARQELEVVAKVSDTLLSSVGIIETDAALLTAIRNRVVSYLDTPAFVQKVAEHYGEDFPQSVPLLAAKMEMLAKLEAGVRTKQEELRKEIDAVGQTVRKLDKLNPYAEFEADLNDIKQKNEARKNRYDSYANSARRSRIRTTDYTPHGQPTAKETVYVDNSPSLFEIMLWHELLTDDGHHDASSSGNAYTADLLGANAETAAALDLPNFDFDAAALEAAQPFDFDLSSIEQSDFNKSAGYEAPSSSNFDFDQGRVESSSPSFGNDSGPSHS